MSKPVVLITGAAGRVGTLLRPLLAPRYALRLVDISVIANPQPGEEILQGDLSDPDVALSVVTGTVGVIHLAAAVAPNLSFQDSLAPNYTAVLNLLEACRQCQVDRFVFASSHHAVGLYPSNAAVNEDALPAPDGFYGLSKAFGEAACALYARRFGIKTLAVRIGNADPQVVDGRRERLWTSAADLTSLIELGLSSPTLGFEVVYGISNCPDPLLKGSTAAALGYVPQQHASEHRADGFRPLATLGKEDGVDFVGGLFAVTPLPSALATP